MEPNCIWLAASCFLSSWNVALGLDSPRVLLICFPFISSNTQLFVAPYCKPDQLKFDPGADTNCTPAMVGA
jgi:hypothetical protein